MTMPDPVGDNNPIDRLSDLMERLAQDAAKRGLHLVNFVIQPGKRDELTGELQGHFAHGVFQIDSELALKDDEQRVADDEFRRMMAAERDAERTQQVEDAKQRQIEMLKELQGPEGGILGDD